MEMNRKFYEDFSKTLNVQKGHVNPFNDTANQEQLSND